MRAVGFVDDETDRSISAPRGFGLDDGVVSFIAWWDLVPRGIWSHRVNDEMCEGSNVKEAPLVLST